MIAWKPQGSITGPRIIPTVNALCTLCSPFQLGSPGLTSVHCQQAPEEGRGGNMFEARTFATKGSKIEQGSEDILWLKGRRSGN